jgi:hypothetical protein
MAHRTFVAGYVAAPGETAPVGPATPPSAAPAPVAPEADGDPAEDGGGTPRPRGALADFVLVAFRRRTYRSIAYLLLTFPLGLGYFVFVTVGFALGFGLLVAVVGIPILFLVLAGIWRLMRFERRLAADVLDEPIAAPFADEGAEDGWWTNLRGRMVDRRTYTGAGFLLAKLPLGIAGLAATIFAVALPAALLGASLTFPFDGGIERIGGWKVDTAPEAALAAALALPAALLALHLLTGLARFQARLARSALGGRQTSEV